MAPKRNLFLDSLKCIMCILVPLGHARFPGTFGWLCGDIGNFIIPVFMMISGYYAWRPQGDAYAVIRRRMLRLCKVMAAAVPIHLAFYFWLNLENGNMGLWISQWLTPSTWFKILIGNDLDIFGCMHLWFIAALIYGYLLIMFVEKHRLWNFFYRLIPLMLLCRLGVTIATETLGISKHMSSNWLTVAFPFLVIGHWFAEHPDFPKRVPVRPLIPILVLALAFDISDDFITYPGLNVTTIGTMIFELGIFVLALRYPERSLGRWVEPFATKYSMTLYIVHIIVMFSWLHISWALGLDQQLWFQWFTPIGILIVSFLCAVVWDRFKTARRAAKAA